MAHILLLEPNHLLASQYQKYLESIGHSVTISTNAQNGINTADVATPDIVIIELLLAAHSGIEFLYEFRSYGEWRLIPVVILSRISRSDISASDRTLQDLGVRAFLYKPETTLKRLGQILNSELASLQTETAQS